MRFRIRAIALPLLVVLVASSAQADKYDDTIKTFKSAGQSKDFFDKSYGYAVFPTIGKGGFGIGGAHGSGHDVTRRAPTWATRR